MNVFSLLGNAADGHIAMAWIGAIRTSNGGWKWHDNSEMTWSNWASENDEQSAAVIDGETGKWNTRDSGKTKGFICKKMRKFSNCVATVEFHHCGHSGTNERQCHGEIFWQIIDSH